MAEALFTQMNGFHTYGRWWVHAREDVVESDLKSREHVGIPEELLNTLFEVIE